MANSKISALSAQTTLADTDMLVVANSGSTTSKITALNMKKDASFSKATSMPGAPATNQMCFRTDLGLLFYYDGTRWLSVNKYMEPFPAASSIAGTSFVMQMSPYQDLDMYVEKLMAFSYVASGNSGSAYWTITLQKYDAAGTGTSLGTFNTSADTSAVRTLHSITVNAALGGSATYKALIADIAKTSTPGNVDVYANLVYRLIGT